MLSSYTVVHILLLAQHTLVRLLCNSFPVISMEMVCHRWALLFEDAKVTMTTSSLDRSHLSIDSEVTMTIKSLTFILLVNNLIVSFSISAWASALFVK